MCVAGVLSVCVCVCVCVFLVSWCTLCTAIYNYRFWSQTTSSTCLSGPWETACSTATAGFWSASREVRPPTHPLCVCVCVCVCDLCSLVLPEIAYDDVFRLWETIWAARKCVSNNFEEFFALGIMVQFKTAIMDAHLDPSDILNLFTGRQCQCVCVCGVIESVTADLAEKRSIDAAVTITIAQNIVQDLQSDLTKK